jgi:hypothetical protein
MMSPVNVDWETESDRHGYAWNMGILANLPCPCPERWSPRDHPSAETRISIIAVASDDMWQVNELTVAVGTELGSISICDTT